jgi:hypothetical protein
VFAILRAGDWGLVEPKPGAPHWFGLSPAIWLLLLGSPDTSRLPASWPSEPNRIPASRSRQIPGADHKRWCVSSKHRHGLRAGRPREARL